MVPLARSTPLIIEMNISKCGQLTNASIYNILLHSPYLRELIVHGNINITDQAFPNIPELYELEDYELVTEAKSAPAFATTASLTPPEQIPKMLRPTMERLDMLREVDLTSCTSVNDKAIANLVDSAPRLRVLTVAKCPEITDVGLASIGKLGKSLHHLHLGHVVQ
jgi:F-box and leucine-rich repeat protein GRR1